MTLMTTIVLAAGPLAGAAASTAAARLGKGQSWLTGEVPGLPILLSGAMAGGVIGALAIVAAPVGTVLLTALLGWLLLALALIDFRIQILPNGLNLLVFVLGGVMVGLTKPELWIHHLAGALAGFASLWIVETLYRRVRGLDGLGRGDAKLLGALGMWVTWIGIAPVLLVASLAGIGAVLIGAVLKGERVTSTTSLAFGPWIALGGWLVWLAGPAVASLLYP